MESFEEKVCVFMDEHSYHSNESELHASLEDLCLSEQQSSDSEEDSPQRILYWDSQVALLQEILERYNITGSKLRQEVGRIINKIKASDFCSCLKPNSHNCITCLRRRVATVLSDRGITTNLCMSKWKSTHKVPGGSHEYIEVIASTSTRKRQIRFLIELELKEQFQIAKAGEEYQKIVSCLPEFYVGKAEYLTAIVRVVCDAAKKSMKKKKMHLAPWRKNGFMQMKWSGFNQTYHHHHIQQASESNMGFSRAPNAVVAVN
ncbi:uncharacterized protein [Cicer arietinum]|uniref:Uncharacterized protein LOC101497479 n=1 Tax=Cicer arietinum TaxID=3827 RepID=A0A1S2YXG3_CICAR|nr:uncharacterized protein LOC101497479 [Cicer arietinum]